MVSIKVKPDIFMQLGYKKKVNNFTNIARCRKHKIGEECKL
jgi:hypothetical protein